MFMSEDLVLYLKKVKFKKQLEKLQKKLKGKKVVLYGAGLLFECVKDNYGLDGIDIIGISDKSFDNFDSDFCGYKKIPTKLISTSGADCVLISTFRYLNILDDLEKMLVDFPKIEILPLIDRPFWELFKEIWS